MSLDQGRKLGLVGAILLIIGSVIPFLSPIGMILMFKGMMHLSDYYKDEGIYKDTLYGFGSAMISIVCFEYILTALLLGYVFPGYNDLIARYIDTVGLSVYGLSILWTIGLGFVSYVFAATFFTTAFTSLAKKTGKRIFRIAGLLFPTAAVVTVIGYAMEVTFAYMPQIILQEYIRLGFAFAGPAVIIFALIIATIAFTSIKTK